MKDRRLAWHCLDISQFSVDEAVMRWPRGDGVVRLGSREAEQMKRMNYRAAQDRKAITALAEGLKALAAGRLFISIDEMFDPKTEALRKSFNDTASALCR